MYTETTFIKSICYTKKLFYKNIEICFIGRSNSGKSSAINALINKKISFTSKIPGKTKCINIFKIKKDYYLTDTPGYGYAKTNKKNLFNINYLIENYIKNKKNLTCIILLIDSKVYLKNIDYNFLKINKKNIIHILFTKTDKLSKNEQNKISKTLKKIKQNSIKKNITYQQFTIKKKIYINILKIKIKQFICL